jgi:hypothetical protein
MIQRPIRFIFRLLNPGCKLAGCNCLTLPRSGSFLYTKVSHSVQGPDEPGHRLGGIEYFLTFEIVVQVTIGRSRVIG